MLTRKLRGQCLQLHMPLTVEGLRMGIPGLATAKDGDIIIRRVHLTTRPPSQSGLILYHWSSVNSDAGAGLTGHSMRSN